MAHLHLLYVHRFKDRHGRARHYFRRAGFKTVPLPGEPGSREFMRAYGDALAGVTAPKVEPGSGGTIKGSLDDVAIRYYRGAEFGQLAGVTKATYRNRIERLRAEHGDKPFAAMERRHVRAMIAARVDKPAAANGILKILKVLARFALDEGIIKVDPTHGVRRVREKPDGFATWTEEHIVTFETRWSTGSRERLALALLLYTGQRKGDVVRMGRQHVRGGAIQVQQGKDRHPPGHPHPPGPGGGTEPRSTRPAYVPDHAGGRGLHGGGVRKLVS